MCRNRELVEREKRQPERSLDPGKFMCQRSGLSLFWHLQDTRNKSEQPWPGKNSWDRLSDRLKGSIALALAVGLPVGAKDAFA
jgi:hypothetical protein